MASGEGDVLSAASLLLAITAVLYSLWYADISAALKIEPPQHLEDAKSERRQVSGALWSRALPLAVAGVVMTAVFLPEAVRIVREWVDMARGEGLWHAVKDYEPVSLSLVLVVAGMTILSVYTILMTYGLWRLRRWLKLPSS
jgi:hypothetical protein